ncbi:MAG: hypothetical protein JKY81_09610 [Colwellia sp.]|nr:hypothetical protein [Colwellia sp.]
MANQHGLLHSRLQDLRLLYSNVLDIKHKVITAFTANKSVATNATQLLKHT